jgi:hypothetical protein
MAAPKKIWVGDSFPPNKEHPKTVYTVDFYPTDADCYVLLTPHLKALIDGAGLFHDQWFEIYQEFGAREANLLIDGPLDLAGLTYILTEKADEK